MNAEKLAHSADNDRQAPDDIAPELHAMWLARNGQWDKAHDLCQKIPGSAGSWIHAWLHRQEGDYGNACYWYSRAGKPAPAADASLDDEWLGIVESLI
ncbi:hypothetical protein ACFQY0_15905 [Haloferula chungangensis]|uniref:Tetratricopeptide repeat protein n=1 Tax=Haloferula chungangensis TaxID=1048331 RepID=A0ABW2LAR4_9BACT